MRRLAVVSAVLLFACPKPALAPFDAGARKPPLVFGGDRPVTLSVPRAYAGRPTPLVVVLHGFGSSGVHHASYLGLDSLVDTRGVLLVAPDGTVDPEGSRFWNTGSAACCNFHGSSVDDVKYLRELIAAIRGAYNVDPRRIYLVGHSNGGFLAHRLGCELSPDVAAVVSVSGTRSLDQAECHAKAPVSVLQVHGDRDVGVRFNGGTNILGKGGGPYEGALETTGRWARENRCGVVRSDGEPIDLESRLPGAETTVSNYDGCPAGIDVTVWTIQEGSHVPAITAAFPGLVWRWLEAHPRLP